MICMVFDLGIFGVLWKAFMVFRDSDISSINVWWIILSIYWFIRSMLYMYENHMYSLSDHPSQFFPSPDTYEKGRANRNFNLSFLITYANEVLN